MRPDDVGLGGFDSHTLPPGRGCRHALEQVLVPAAVVADAVVSAALAVEAFVSAALFSAALLASVAAPVRAQQRDTTVRLPARDSLLPLPPVTPRKAFLQSVLVPGLGQSALDRRYTGAGFFLVEVVAIAFVHRTAEDLRTARAFLGDSVPLTYAIDATTGVVSRDQKGDPIVATWQKSSYTADLVRARKLQLEDWVAVLIFNHLIAGADAFVAAQLWDLPQHVKLRAFPVPRGAGVSVGLRFP